MATIQGSGFLLLCLCIVLYATSVVHADTYQLFADSRPESLSTCAAGNCNPFSSCFTWQNGEDILANYPNGIGPIDAPRILTTSTDQTGFGYQYYLPWPSTEADSVSSGLLFSGHNKQTITFGSWFSVAILQHKNFPIKYATTQVCNKLQLSIPFALTDSNSQSDTTTISVSFTIEETPNNPCNGLPGAYIYPKTSALIGQPQANGTYPPGWANAGLGVCPYGSDCTTTVNAGAAANCFGTLNAVVCPTGCYDRVGITGGYTDNHVFNLNGRQFFLAVVGFTSSSQYSPTDIPINTFTTVENSNNIGYLYARMIEKCDTDLDCNDSINCTIDSCLSSDDPRNIWFYTNKFCYHTFSNTRCNNGCATGTCTAAGCNMNPPASTNTCPSLKCKSNSCVESGSTFVCQPISITPDPCKQTSNCAFGGECTTDGTACLCYTATTTSTTITTKASTTTTSTTTTTPTTTTTTTTTPIPNAIVPKLRCIECDSNKKRCRIVFGYQILGTLTYPGQQDNSVSILPNSASNFITVTIGGTTTKYVDVGQPGIFTIGPSGTEIYSAGYFSIDLPNSPAVVTWTLGGLTSSVTSWSNTCQGYSWCYQQWGGEIISNLCSWVETDDSTSDLSFWYSFSVAKTPICRSSGGKVESLVIKLPRCTNGITVLSSADSPNCLASRSPSPGGYITSSSNPDTELSAETCLFDPDDGNMGSPGWDAFDIPLNLLSNTNCTIGIRVSKAMCGDISYPTGGALQNTGRISFVSSVECQGSADSSCGAGNCNTWPILGPIASQCVNGQYPSCSTTTYVNIKDCTCIDCPPCPVGSKFSTLLADNGLCKCVPCPVRNCSQNYQPDASNHCNPCVYCKPTCTCPASSTCPWRVSYLNSTCGECIQCQPQPNKTLTYSSSNPNVCQYQNCNPKCSSANEITPNDACASCIPCNETAVKATCLGNQTTKGHTCYCSNCTRDPHCSRDGQTWANPSDLCNSTCVNCPPCPTNTSYQDSLQKCRYGASCVPCPIAGSCTTLSGPTVYRAPDPSNPCSCINCPPCANGTITSPTQSCGCTPCPDQNCSALTGMYGGTDCSHGCKYDTNAGTSVVNLCLACVPCSNAQLCPANWTYDSTDYCKGCNTPCTVQLCPTGQVLKTPSDTCSTCVPCQGQSSSSPGYIACPANQTLNKNICQCEPCVAKECLPPLYYNSNDACSSKCEPCTTSKKCPANQTWDGVSYCNPCVDCDLILNGGCGFNQLFVPSTQANVCPTCDNCTSTKPACRTNTQRDPVNLCQCNPCPQPTCELGQYFDPNDFCSGCKNCTEVVCNPANQQYVNATYQKCQSCHTCTAVSCSAGWKLNTSDICSGCFKCVPGVNVPTCPVGQKPDPKNNCECITCVPLTPANCTAWQTKVSNDTCATTCEVCNPGCNYNTTKPDPSTNGCTCMNCTATSGGGEGKHMGADVQLAHGTARDVQEQCCPDLYLIPNYCQVVRNLSADFEPYQCDCHNCTEFKECGVNQRLVGCDCVNCPLPPCNPWNETVGASYCDPCEPCIEEVCGPNATREGLASQCDPCRECQEPQCPPNSRVNYTDLCSPCIPCDPLETVCDFGWKVDPADSCQCIECSTTCGHSTERVSSNPCDGCQPCPTDCPLNYTRPDVCQNCTICEIPEPADSFQVNWTDVCQPTFPCLEEETAATCPGNWTVNASNLCECIPCPEPICGANQERTSGDFCDGCTFCPDPECQVNETLKTGDFCDGCEPCAVKDCPDNYQVDWSNICSPCTYCNSQDTVCAVNFTVDLNSTCNCIACPDSNCTGNQTYASDNLCDGCVTCIPEVCETNFTRPEGLLLCDPCVPCEEFTCASSTMMMIAEGACPYCEPCVPGSNVDNCTYGWEVDPLDSCDCIPCEPPVCRTNFSAPVDPCGDCVPCPEPVCPKNQTVFDTCFGCIPCTTICPIGNIYADPSDICKGCTPCPPPNCPFGFSLASNLCSCQRCNVTTCPSGFELDVETGCGCNKCVDIICPIGTLLTADGCNCETTTIYDEPNITTTRCNKTSRDYCGVCFGNNRTCIGCDGQVGGQRYIDACGVICGLGNTCPGCTGQTCNICTEKVDLCGVCGGNSTTCDGCDGVPASGSIYDICGVCAGNGTTCLGCYGIPFGPACPSGVTAGEAAAVSILVALASLGCVILAMILWRMRSQPEILFQEWDNLIAEHLTEIQQNPLCTSNEPEVNPLFHLGGPPVGPS